MWRRKHEQREKSFSWCEFSLTGSKKLKMKIKDLFSDVVPAPSNLYVSSQPTADVFKLTCAWTSSGLLTINYTLYKYLTTAHQSQVRGRVDGGCIKSRTLTLETKFHMVSRDFLSTALCVCSSNDVTRGNNTRFFLVRGRCSHVETMD